MTTTAAQLVIDEEFRSLIPPLTKEELEQLETNLVADGCRDPLALWRGTVIDGHNRYEICERRGIGYRTVEINLADRDAVTVWIIQNQFGRRNLSNFTRVELALKLEPLLAAKAKANQTANLKRGDSVPQKSAEREKPMETREQLAKIAGVSHDTISKGKFVIAHADEETKQKLRSNQATVNQVAREIKARLDQDHDGASVESQPAATKLPASERVRQITKLASEGNRAEQIAEEMNISVEHVRNLARKASVRLPDADIGRTRRIDPARVIAESVNALEGVAMGLGLVAGASLASIDKQQLQAWSDSITTSLETIRTVRKQIKEAL